MYLRSENDFITWVFRIACACRYIKLTLHIERAEV